MGMKIHRRVSPHWRTTLLAPKLKVKGMLWEFHKGDDDFSPSVPHGHSQDGKFKLQLWTGNIFNVSTGKLEYRAKRKDMTALYNHPGFLEFVKECRTDYASRHPSVTLPELAYKSYRCKRRRKAPQQNAYCFYIKNDFVRNIERR